MKRVLFIVLTIALLSLTACNAVAGKKKVNTTETKATTEKVVGIKEGMMFKDFQVEVEPGKIVKLSDYVGKGKYVIVDFWASWCGPCKREIPNLKAIYEKYKGEKFDMLSVAVWDDPNESLRVAKDFNITWNHIINAQKTPTEIYKIEGIPHIILFGPDGTILKRDLRGEAIGKEVAKYLGE